MPKKSLSKGERASYDLVILGSGSTAFAAALRAVELGARVAMTEHRTLGGTCVARGCLPSKNLIAAARLVWEARHPRYRGLSQAQMAVDFDTLVKQKDELVSHYRQGRYQSIVDESDAIDVYYGRARLAGEHEVVVGDRRLRGEHVLIATGSRPLIPPVPGLGGVPSYLTSDLLTVGEPQELHELPGSLAIIGAGYVALELGQMFHRLGSRVTLIEPSERLLPRMEPEVGDTLVPLLRKEGLEVFLGARVTRVERTDGPDRRQVALRLQTGGHGDVILADQVLVAAGRQPNTDGIGLEEAGVELDAQGFVRVDRLLRTSRPNIWAAGDVIGLQQGSQLATPVGAFDGAIAAENALAGAGREVDHTVVPRAIFTEPEVASVGLTEEQAVRTGHRCACRVLELEWVPKARATYRTDGFIKMVADRDSHRVLGVTMVGHDASEAIHEAAMGLELGARIEHFRQMIHVYPTMAEALKLVATSFFKDVRRLSCCAD
ncbi:MAG: mercury(II) reductase [Bacillota bacterium]